MSQLFSHVLLALSVLVGSAIPFLPTGELVSGAAVLADHSVAGVAVIFGISWLFSVAGDTLLLLEVRLSRRHLQGWIERRRFGARVVIAQQTVSRNAFTAVITGRLVPGGRAPVIMALGLSHFPIRRFVVSDTVACAIWAAIYAVIGSIGGQVASQPVWGMVIAIAAALAASLVVQQVRRVQQHRRPADGPQADHPQADLASFGGGGEI